MGRCPFCINIASLSFSLSLLLSLSLSLPFLSPSLFLSLSFSLSLSLSFSLFLSLFLSLSLSLSLLFLTSLYPAAAADAHCRCNYSSRDIRNRNSFLLYCCATVDLRKIVVNLKIVRRKEYQTFFYQISSFLC